MWRHVVANFLTVAILALLALAAVLGWAREEYSGPGPLTQAICLKVEKGSNFRKVAEDLAARGAVDWPF
ncbi:MAG: branched-chain alpha-keto acid dehydrogenase subunit E2, partial [Rhodobacteraceae bacterium]|nr:branched-chain alpha-keto acid dehydrogenase subunit E2 [Paracoccaceae bacterium]